MFTRPLLSLGRLRYGVYICIYIYVYIYQVFCLAFVQLDEAWTTRRATRDQFGKVNATEGTNSTVTRLTALAQSWAYHTTRTIPLCDTRTD